jgi:hypothetical protein
VIVIALFFLMIFEVVPVPFSIWSGSANTVLHFSSEVRTQDF